MNIMYRRVTQVAMVGAVSLIVGTRADAATVGARWDPFFGGNVNVNGNLWWEGTADFTIPNDCLSGANTDSGPVLVLDDNSACNMALESAVVTLYNGEGGQGAGTSVYNFGFENFNFNTEGMLIKRIGETNRVIGIQTEAYSFLQGSPTSTSDGVYAGPLWLWFTQPGDGFDPANASTACISDSGPIPCDEGFVLGDYQSNPAILTYLETCIGTDCLRVTAVPEQTAVPEPGTMGLALGALGAGWFAKRRKKTA